MTKYMKVAVPDDFDPAAKHKLVLTTYDEHEDEQTKAVWTEYIDTDLTFWQPIYRNVHDCGFIGLQDFMGDDDSVVRAARVSYGSGTKRLSEDQGLIRYLMRHRHTTPFEMVEFLWHVKLPIFVERQWIRHRTASVNEMSGRYSILDNEMYLPASDKMAPQAKDNKQGRAGSISEANAQAVTCALDEIYEEAYQTYMYLLGETDKPADPLNVRRMAIEEAAMAAVRKLRHDNTVGSSIRSGPTPDFVRPEDVRHPEWANPTTEMIDEKIKEYYEANGLAIVDSEYPGLARELARMVLPVATYTQKYWKCDLKNTLGFISLRSDPHAQYEIRAYSDAMMDMMTPITPWCIQAFLDYEMKGMKLSTFEVEAVREMLSRLRLGMGDTFNSDLEAMLKEKGASAREVREFLAKF